MRRGVSWIIALAAALAARAQPPAISQNGVVNLASQMPPALAASPIARGAVFQVLGVRLTAPGAPTRIRLARAATSISVQPISAEARHIEAVMPADAPLGKLSLTVMVGDQASLPAPIEVVASNPAIFTRSGKGWGPADADNIKAAGKRVMNDIDQPAAPGQSVALRVTGHVDRNKIHVWLGSKPAAVVGHTRRIGPGREEITVRLPGDTPQGCFVPVVLSSAEFPASNFASLAVRAGSSRCGDEQHGTAPLIGPRAGVLLLGRTRTDEDGRETIWDELVGTFAEAQRGLILAPLAMPPPAGTCTFFAGSYQSGIAVPRTPSSAMADEIGGRGLDSGREIVISGPGGDRTVTAPTGTPGSFIAKLGGDGGPPPVRRPFFRPGSYQISGTGGPELGPFRITLEAPPEFEWTNRGQISVIDRNKPLTVTWQGAASDRSIAIVIMNVDPASTALGTCFCVANAQDGRFTVPAGALRNLPRGEDHPDPPLNVIELLSAPARTSMRAFGSSLDSGAAFSVFGSAKLVSFR